MSLDSDLDRTKTRWIWEEVQALVCWTQAESLCSSKGWDPSLTKPNE